MNKKITIALDAMGGDYGPDVTVPAAIKAITELGIKVVLVGDENEINTELKKYPKEKFCIFVLEVKANQMAL